MTSSIWSPLRALWLAACAGTALSSATAFAEDRSPEAWVEQLRSADFDKRRIACERLLALGSRAREALESAAEDAEPEQGVRIAGLLEKIPCGTLSIFCCGADGKPRPNLEGDIEINGIQPPREGKTDQNLHIKTGDDGVAEIALPCRGRIGIYLRFGEGWQSPYQIYPHLARAGVNVATVIVEPACTYKCSVRDEDGKPIAGAQPCLVDRWNLSPVQLDLELRPGPAHFSQLAETGPQRDKSRDSDAAGEWSWKNLYSGNHAFAIHAGDEHSMGWTSLTRGWPGETVQLEPVVLKKRKPGALEIEMKNPDGSPLIINAVQIHLELQTETEVFRRYDNALRQQLNSNGNNAPNSGPRGRRPGFPVQFGKVTRENITPGKYRVFVMNGEYERLFDAIAEIKPGETTKLALQQPPTWPAVKGRVVDLNGAGYPGAYLCLIPEEAVRRFAVQDSPAALEHRLYAYANAERLNWIASDQEGGYTTAHVPPGRYAAMWSTYRNSVHVTGILFGIDAQKGQTSAAPELKLPFAIPKEDSAAPKFTGRVVPPDGTGIKGCRLVFESPSCNAECGVDEQGRFTMELNSDEVHAGKPIAGTLCIFADGCKPLTVSGELKQELEFKLELQEYGGAQVRFVDDAGRPVQNANVLIVNQRDVLNGQFNQNQYCNGGLTTDARGAASMDGLCVGTRELRFYCPGFYLPGGKASFEVKANAKTETIIRVEKGVTLKGRVKLGAPASSRQDADGPPAPQNAVGPPAPQGIMACLSNDSHAPVGADGSFAFARVSPGTYFLYALAPGMVFKNALKVVVPDEPAKVRAGKWDGFELELAPPHGLALDFGAERAGRQIKLIALGHETDERRDGDPLSSRWCETDGAGRAEFPLLPPGKYMAELTDSRARGQPIEAPQLIVLDNEEATIQVGELVRYAETFVAQSNAHDAQESGNGITAGPFDAQPIPAPAGEPRPQGSGIAQLPGIKIERVPAQGKVKFQLKTTPGEFTRQIKLEVRSARFHAEHQGPLKLWAAPGDEYAFQASGEVPSWYRPRPSTVCEFHNLPAGEYKVVAVAEAAQNNFFEPDEASPKVVEMGAFAVKNSESVDLGELSLEALNPFKASARKGLTAQTRMALLPRDREEGR